MTTLTASDMKLIDEIDSLSKIVQPLQEAASASASAADEVEDEQIIVEQSFFFKKPAPTKPSLVFGDWLYVGTYIHASSKDILDELNVKYIVDVEQGGKKAAFLDDSCYIARPMCDMGTTTITNILDELFQFINAARQANQKVLVQCEWGINRSVTVTVAYLIKHHNMTLRDALILLRDRRPLSRPRDNYVQQLMILERQWQPSRAESDYFRFEELNQIYDF